MKYSDRFYTLKTYHKMGLGLGIQLGGRASKAVPITWRAGRATFEAVFEKGTKHTKEALEEYIRNKEKEKKDKTLKELETGAVIEQTARVAALSSALIAAEEVSKLSAESVANEITEIIDQNNKTLDSGDNVSLPSSSLVEQTSGYGELKDFIKELSMSGSFSRATRERLSYQKIIQPEIYLECLQAIEFKLEVVMEWLEEHKTDEVFYSVETPQLTEIIVQLIAGMGNLKRLADDVEKLYMEDKPIAESHIGSIKRGVGEVIKAFGNLSYYRLGKSLTERESNLFPKIMDSKEIHQWESKLQY